jgi:hypothetical protein
MQTMMRQQMVETLEDMLLQDKRMVIILADISDDLFHRQRQEVREPTTRACWRVTSAPL